MRRMLRYERTNAVVSLVLIGLALYSVLEFPRNPTAVTIFGTPLGVDYPQQWLVALLLTLLGMAGSDMVMREHPLAKERQLAYLATFWMLPGLLVAGASQILALFPNVIVWGLAVAAFGLILWLTILAEFNAMTSEEQRWPQLWLQFVGYALAIVLFSLIFRANIRAIITLIVVFLTSGALSVALLRQTPETIGRTWLFATAIAITTAQLAGALSYWRTTALTTSVALFLCLYLLITFARQYFADTLSLRTVWEFGTIVALSIAVIFFL